MGQQGQGASHGGPGRNNAYWDIVGQGAGYGNYIWPTTMGSSGCCGSGGRGGSSMTFEIQTSFTFDGSITTKGAKGSQHHGSGAGGSILVTTPTIQGTGSLIANGGNFWIFF